MKTISLIAATSLNGVYAQKVNDKWIIPWKNKEDMKHFKNITTGNTIIMGKDTFLDIGKALPNRQNIVVSTTLKQEELSENVLLATSLKDAINKSTNPKVFVIGGFSLWEEAMTMANELFLTIIDKYIGECDSSTLKFFPLIPDRLKIHKITTLQSCNIQHYLAD